MPRSPLSKPLSLLMGLCLCLVTAPVFADDTVSSVSKKPTHQYRPGKMVWVDLLTTDLRKAGEFYYEVFGWDVDYSKDGTFANVKYDGQPLATLSLYEEGEAPDGEAQWLVSLSVADLDAAAATVERAGGEVVGAMQELPERGRYALVRDPQGAMFMLLKATGGDPRDPTEEDPVQNNTWLWPELWTRDRDAAAEFYSAVIGYRSVTIKDESGDDIVILGRDGTARASVVEIPWDDVEPNWLPYLRVNDIVAATRGVVNSGGEVVIAPIQDSDGSRIAVVADPTGGVFAIQQRGANE